MNRFILVAAVGMVVVALSWGFSIVGGPSQGRAEKRDAERGQDLQRLRRYLECRREDAVLPQSLADETYCSGLRAGVRFNDPVTGAAYTYKRVSDMRFDICAVFEMPPRKRFQTGRWLLIVFDGQTGCLSGQKQVS